MDSETGPRHARPHRAGWPGRQRRLTAVEATLLAALIGAIAVIVAALITAAATVLAARLDAAHHDDPVPAVVVVMVTTTPSPIGDSTPTNAVRSFP